LSLLTGKKLRRLLKPIFAVLVSAIFHDGTDYFRIKNILTPRWHQLDACLVLDEGSFNKNTPGILVALLSQALASLRAL
jgi:hypothetical protein